MFFNSGFVTCLPAVNFFFRNPLQILKKVRRSQAMIPCHRFYQFHLVHVCLSVNILAWQEHSDCICFQLYDWLNIWFLCYSWVDVLWKESFPLLTWKFNIHLIWSRKNMQFYKNEKKEKKPEYPCTQPLLFFPYK